MAYQKKEDQDAFLTSLEGKLRGPYSSLELSKIIQTKSLRGNLSSEDYLKNISQVISRTDKTTYLRTIVGLLGLEPGKDTDEEVYKILTDAQVSTNEDWVRVVAGLARGILFVDEDGDNRESCRGEEASSLLDKTCREIVEQTRELEQATEDKQDGKNSLENTDMYPLFVSYRFSLLDPQLLDRVIPEHKQNPYFQCDEGASILTVDDALEKAKAEESQDHNVISSKPAAAPPKDAATKKPEAIMPGISKSSKSPTAVSKKASSRPKSSMFMPSKRPGMTAGRVGGRIPTKGTLHTRKAGAAQTLLGKTRPRSIGGAGGAARSAQMGRAKKLANTKSRMKMMDVSEVQALNNNNNKGNDKASRKRKILEAAAKKGLVAAQKVRKLEPQATSMKAATAADDDDDDDDGPDPMEMINSNAGNGFMAFGDDDEDDDDDEEDNNTATVGGELQEILKRSNKLSDEDKVRVQQFFTNRHNPTPDTPIYKMKLHEERTTDPATGQAMKETYYLELDYSTGNHQQSKKTKRY